MSEMGAARFKAHCLQVMETVRRTRRPVTITKRGVPVARLVPAEPREAKSIFGYMADKTAFVDDVDRPAWTEEEWKAFERQRQEQWQAWDREWLTYGTISGKKTVGRPAGLARRKKRATIARRRRR
jgi:prevent-host-death family protein